MVKKLFCKDLSIHPDPELKEYVLIHRTDRVVMAKDGFNDYVKLDNKWVKTDLPTDSTLTAREYIDQHCEMIEVEDYSESEAPREESSRAGRTDKKSKERFPIYRKRAIANP